MRSIAHRDTMLAAVGAGLLALACAGGPGPGPGLDPGGETETDREPGSGAQPSPGPAAADAREGKSAEGFPSPQQLESLGAQEVPQDTFRLDVVDVERWKLTGPFPTRLDVTPHADPSPFGTLLAEAAGRRAGLAVPTEAMNCVAREMGLFYLAHAAQPAENLKRFILASCRASIGSVALRYVHADDIPKHLPDSQIIEQWQHPVNEMLVRQLVGGPQTAGIWFGRRGDRAVIMLASGERVIRLDPVDTVLGRNARVGLRGEVLHPARGVEASINRGRYAMAECEAQPGIAPPRFHFVCEADRGDRSAWINIQILPSNRILARSALDLLVWPSGREDAVYERPSYARSRPAADGAALRDGFLELLNGVRKKAGLPPLRLAARQSAMASELAPHLFAALSGQAHVGTADLVALGLLAGWHVDGIVQNGHIAWSWVRQSNDVEQLLSSVLEHPNGRRTLLSRDAQRLAVGGMLNASENAEETFVAAVFGTYSLFSAEEHEANARRVLERLEEARADRGLGAPERLDDLAPLCLEAAGRIQGGEEPAQALDALIHGSMAVLGRPVQGWMVEVRELDDLVFPEDFLAAPRLSLSMGVSFRRPEGEPWGRYVVMIVASVPEQRRI